ncbi:MAG: PQQ-binding-like beta-propeller repeat protein [Planctomycetaceae bacterium]|nr:PQQ-binding-like beta-propeller repeat protein [Planctomycetaceae bacterium]
MSAILEASCPVLGDIVLRSVLMLLLGAATVTVLRRASAAARHFVWTSVIGGVLILPVLMTAVPQAKLLPRWPRDELFTGAPPGTEPISESPVTQFTGLQSTNTPSEPIDARIKVTDGRAIVRGPLPDDIHRVANHSQSAVSIHNGERPIRVQIVLFVAWTVGVFAHTLAVILGLCRVIRLSRTSLDITTSTGIGQLQALCARMGVIRPIRLLKSATCPMPATWCLSQAYVLVPAEFEDWSLERQEAVLLHELAHIARHDGEIQILTRIACALYWFNPLIWFASRQMARERELACDDLVLRAGQRPSDYAEHLLRVATQMCRRRRPIANLSTEMVGQSDIGERVRAILDTSRCREPLSGRILLFGTITASLVVLSFGMLSSVPLIAETTNRSVDGIRDAVAANDDGALPSGAVLRLGTGRFRQEGPVRQLQYSPDGLKIATINDDAILIWDVHSGKVLRQLRRSHPTEFARRFAALAFAPDGKEIAATDGSALHLWDVETGLELLAFDSSTPLFVGIGGVTIRYSPQGDRLAMTDGPNVVLFDTTTGERLQQLTIEGQRGSITGICWTSDGMHLSASTVNRPAVMWNVESGAVVRSFMIPQEQVSPTSLTMSADDKLLIVATIGKLHLWRLDTGEPLKDIELDAEYVHTLVLSPNGRTLIVGGQDGTIRVVDVESGQLKRRIESGLQIGLSLAVSPDFKSVILGAVVPTLRQWDIESGKEIVPELTSFGHDAEVRCAAWSPDGRLIASGGANRQINLWDAETGRLKLRIPSPSSASTIAFTPSGEQLLTSWENAEAVHVWDVATGDAVRSFESGTKRIRSFTLTPDGATLICVGSRADRPGTDSDSHETLQVWNFNTGEKLREIPLRTATTISLALAADGNTLVTGAHNGVIRVRETESGTELATLTGHQHSVEALAFSSDGALLASGSLDQTIRIWDARNWKLLRVLTGHKRAVTAVGFLPDSHLLVSGSGSRSYPLTPESPQRIRVWDADAGEQIGALSGHHSNTTSLVFSPSRNRFVTGHENTTLLVWGVGPFRRQ